ncbi:MAG: rod shape-determining protein MreC [Cyclobacteriaceae bacterium]
MRKLLDFLYRRRTFTIFIGLEFVCIWLIVSYNQRQNADFLNSSNALSARISTSSQNISDYFDLVEINEQLMLENEILQAKLNDRDSFSDSVMQASSELYSVMGARVINNTFRRSSNFLTIAAGSDEGIIPGMGVISAKGVVGQVKSVSAQYATVFSLLHPKVMVSSTVKRTETNCSVQWDQETYDQASLKFVPRHINLKVGDTVVTSGYNSVFPPNVTIGIVSEINLEEHMTFYEAMVKLSVDFTSLPSVFVVVHETKLEKDSIEAL